MKRKPVIFILLAAISTVMGGFYLMPIGTTNSAAAQTKTMNDPPTLDFETEIRQAKSAERKKRDARYMVETPGFVKNIEASDPTIIRELPPGIDMLPLNGHFWQGLSAIPAEQSDTIIIGEVTSATAHLTDDRKGIYSEFSISVREVFKTADKRIQVGKVIDISRVGGVVRFASGKIQKYTIYRQGTPGIGSVYLFFLKHEKDNLYIVTGYDVSRDRIKPLDGEDRTDPMSALPFAKYRDVAKSDLLTDLKAVLSTKKVD